MTKQWKLWLALALLVVFFAGGALGLCAGVIHARQMFFGRHGGFAGNRMREHLRRELQLTPEQYDKVRPILDQTEKRLEEIRAETGQRVREAMNQSHNEIVPLLNPEQRKKLDEMRERHRHIMRMHGGEMPPPPHDGH
ncbi:MAG: periplasmic heavy metal sensor [Verrucomicrobiota bacterium]|nr:periplasmic heavy metal sensor [Verrucomicrobiota bacterium]MDQ6939660.1 periplasmic heavy metal sensor [Verrucomicrobiota bacterium]